MALIIGTNGADLVGTWTASEGVVGGPATAGDDTIQGLDGSDNLSGGAGDDVIDGGAGGGILNGEQGDDTLVGGSDAETLQDTRGNDSMWGGGGDDLLLDSDGVNTLRGGDGDDTLSHGNYVPGSLLDGGDGADLISVFGTAMTTLTGGAGADRFRFSAALSYGSGGALIVTDFEAGEGGDRLDVTDWLNLAIDYAGENPFATGHLRLRQDGADLLVEWDLDGEGGIYDRAAVLRLLDTQISAMTAANFEPGFDPDGSALPGSVITGTEAADTVSATAASPGVTGGPATGGADTIQGLGGRDSLSGGVGGDLIDGGTDDDRLDGNGGNDTLWGGDGADYAFGGTGNDLLSGDGGDDFLTDLSGTDTLLGGDGDDTLSASSVGPNGSAVLDGGDGADWLEARRNGGATLTGGTGSDTIVGSYASGPLVVTDFEAGAGGDVIDVSAWLAADAGYAGGNPFASGHARLRQDGADAVLDWDYNGGGDDYVEAIRLLGTEVATFTEANFGPGFAPDGSTPPGRLITGSSVADTIGTAGVSAGVAGGAPTELGDTIVAGGGDDAVDAAGGGDSLLGGEGNDTLRGAAGDDTLDGGAGNDRLLGGAGDDDYLVTVGDVVVESAEEGVDTVRTGLASYVLPAHVEALIAIGSASHNFIGNGRDNAITGHAGADTLSGGPGNDTLNGGAGSDRLIGGAGDDVYVVTAGDVVVEGAGLGTDTVRTALAAYVLVAHVEALVATTAIAHDFTGNGLNNAITGHGGADALHGMAGDDTLTGAGGNDTLDGGAGKDRMLGGAGDDLYVVAAGDVVVEGTNQGVDTVRTTAAAYVLAWNVENLEATNAIAHRFAGNALNNAITGGAGADTLLGGVGNDTLDGGAGIDRLFGGTGDDTYVVTAGDVIVEGVNQGTDTALVSQAGRYALAANVENAVLSGSLAINAVGNAVANSLVGNAAINILYGMGGADTLSGGGGNDILIGGAGADSLAGGSGNDQFRLTAIADSTLAALDVIADFTFRRGIELDRVDLRTIDANTIAVGNQAFAYRGADFTGAAGDLRVRQAGAASYTAAGDTNGDGVADFAITIRSEAAPEAAWFLL